jgi:NTP pyrophosphatase (non-canonical NTP hydrolase)
MNEDHETTISYFKKIVDKFVIERGWQHYHTPKELIQALSVEVAELSELFLFKNFTIEEILNNKILVENISDEIADVFIYLISIVNSLNLDLTDIFKNKMEKNQKKYSLNEFNNGYYHKK